MDPEAHVVGPVQPMPPHWPYFAAVPELPPVPLPGEVVAGGLESEPLGQVKTGGPGIV